MNGVGALHIKHRNAVTTENALQELARCMRVTDVSEMVPFKTIRTFAPLEARRCSAADRKNFQSLQVGYFCAFDARLQAEPQSEIVAQRVRSL